MAFYLGGSGAVGGKQSGRAHGIDARAAGGSLSFDWDSAPSSLEPAPHGGKRITGASAMPSKASYAQFLKEQMAEKGGGRRALSESRRFDGSPAPGFRGGLGASTRELRGGAGSRDPSPFARLGGAVVNLPENQKKAAYAEHGAELRDELSRRNESKIDAYKRRLSERDDDAGPEVSRAQGASDRRYKVASQEERHNANAERAISFDRFVAGSGRGGNQSEIQADLSSRGAQVFAEPAGGLKQADGHARKAMPPRPEGSFKLGW